MALPLKLPEGLAVRPYAPPVTSFPMYLRARGHRCQRRRQCQCGGDAHGQFQTALNRGSGSAAAAATSSSAAAGGLSPPLGACVNVRWKFAGWQYWRMGCVPLPNFFPF